VGLEDYRIGWYVKETYVYFNNHYRAKAAKGAEMLKSFVHGSDLVRPQ
jgi:uncharacterized protein YecE (DUF72 family)